MSDMPPGEHDLMYNELARQEIANESQYINKDSQKSGRTTVSIIAIIAVAFIALACIIACATVASIFLYNAPW
jgi:hypothetical protein